VQGTRNFRQVRTAVCIIPYVLFRDIVYCALRLDDEFLVGCSADLGTPALLYIF
jgi:hypothetical protein